ncbi:LysR substrate-binding domain-containing protein [Jatrophihabitans telluris]|uniref:LysR substrate-binding domain-containing protein n=1 Tax=Jatrophihabitans telluris TaxID=2038343 RepID=A0ABY4QZ77_9ACTN|nr:LysR substrate-binding domain-containing protein [Jatrophihabitans telluris]UQX88215.1 LysR substrate-binding domain-containing protein [Jatrophihabitans telluris]
MITLHQFRCYLATLETGSFTAAAEQLQLAQPSVSEQVRLLELSVATPLFTRVGRGLVATEAAHALRPHAERALAAVDAAQHAVASVRDLVAGTVRFGVFGTARIYLAADLAADVLDRYPGVRLELVGRNSQEVLTALRRGTVEAAIIALPIEDEGLQITPVVRDEVVYVSADPQRLARPVTPADLATATLVLSEASWGNADSTRRQLARAVQSVGGTLRPRVDVEDIEIALELAARGVGDAITARGLLHRLGDRLDPGLGWVSLRPKIWDEFAVVHRRGAELSPASRAVTELAVARMAEIGLLSRRR